MVEVFDSSAEYDREVKLPLYARARVPEVWIIDLAAPDAVEVYQTPSPDGFTRPLQFSRGATLPVPGLPGVAVEVDSVLG